MNTSHIYPEPNRKEALGTNGVIATAHPLATGAALRILQDGGNAFDAAVSALATLNVVEPYMSGMGGIGAALVHSAREQRVRALDFSGEAPLNSDPSRFNHEDQNTGTKAPLIPGNVAGWFELLENYGSMDKKRVFQPAIDYARYGFPVTDYNHRHFTAHSSRVFKFPEGKSMIYPSGKPLMPGDILKMPALANSLERISLYGKDDFYSGEIANKIIDSMKHSGGILTSEDLANYEVNWTDPISIEYSGHQIFTIPPNSSAFQVLQTLKTVEHNINYNLSYEHPDNLHTMIESVKLCIADRVLHSGDPNFVEVPLEILLSDKYISQRCKLINPMTAMVNAGDQYLKSRPENAIEAGSLSGLTTHLSVADRDGNVVSVTQTLGGGFGSAFAVPETGIFLNNMISFFNLDSESKNVMSPNKRVDFPVAPTQIFKNGNFFVSIGTPGGHTILQTTPQMIINILNYDMSIQQAIEAPRFSTTSGMGVGMEERFPRHIRRALDLRGHEIDILDAWNIGGAQGVLVDSDKGVFYGGADPRRDGLALAY